METAGGGGGGGTQALTSNSSHSRPLRASSRNVYYNYNNTLSSSSSPSTFNGPVRKWHKKWVHVSSSKPSNPMPCKQSNSSILLCKWTPLSKTSSSTAVAGDDDMNSAETCRRKFRYTPIVVFEEQKKLTGKRVAENDKPGEIHQFSKRLDMDTDDIYGMLDINHDLTEGHQESEETFLTPHHSNTSHFNLEPYSESSD